MWGNLIAHIINIVSFFGGGGGLVGNREVYLIQTIHGDLFHIIGVVSTWNLEDLNQYKIDTWQTRGMYVYMYKNLVNQPHNLLKWSQRRIAQSRDLPKLDFPQHTWNWAKLLVMFPLSLHSKWQLKLFKFLTNRVTM